MAGADDVVITVTSPGQRPLALLLQGELIVGRECEGLIIADSEVSRRHLRLQRRGQAVEVADLGSTNGTYLNGVRLGRPEMVNTTSHITLGTTRVLVEMRTAPAPSRQTPAPGSMGPDTTVRNVEELWNTSISLVADSLRGQAPGPHLEQMGGDTVTFLFSDIESSTERAAELGDAAWFSLLDAHNELFRSELYRWGGNEVKSVGDGFLMTFPSVRRALRFAIAVQQRVNSEQGPDLRVRIGMHTGEAISDITGDLFGYHVNLAARVANLARGGQILASLVVREIANGQDGINFGGPTLAQLKGITEPQTVYEVLWSS